MTTTIYVDTIEELVSVLIDQKLLGANPKAKIKLKKGRYHK